MEHKQQDGAYVFLQDASCLRGCLISSWENGKMTINHGESQGLYHLLWLDNTSSNNNNNNI